MRTDDVDVQRTNWDPEYRAEVRSYFSRALGPGFLRNAALDEFPGSAADRENKDAPERSVTATYLAR